MSGPGEYRPDPSEGITAPADRVHSRDVTPESVLLQAASSQW